MDLLPSNTVAELGYRRYPLAPTAPLTISESGFKPW